jgi:hypothetical protein
MMPDVVTGLAAEREAAPAWPERSGPPGVAAKLRIWALFWRGRGWNCQVGSGLQGEGEQDDVRA